MKCFRCRYYYRTMVNRSGYNPSPFCHYFEDTGERPNVLTQECFQSRKKHNITAAVHTAKTKKQDASNKRTLT